MLRRLLVSAALAGGVTWPAGVGAQEIDNPVYVNDSTLAADTLRGLDDLLALDNYAEAVRALQTLLDDEGERVLPSADDPDIYVSVRRRVHEALRRRPELLARYREQIEPGAAQLLASGRWRDVERTRLLTPAGYESALRLAQVELESARFDTALRALEQLEEHPDRVSDAAPAARVLSLVARYVDRPDVWAWAGRWRLEAGLDAVETAAVAPPAVEERFVLSPLAPGAAGDGPPRLDGIVPQPLGDAPLTPIAGELAEAAEEAAPRIRRTSLQSSAWTLPTVVDDTLVTNDGQTVTAWDRFTLRPVWRVRTSVDDEANRSEVRLAMRRARSGLEDSATVTPAGRLLICATGTALSGVRRGDSRLHGIDMETGRVVWSVDVAELDPALDQASVRGPVMVWGDTAVVVARKSVRARRLVSVTLVGLDAQTGRLRWFTPIASAGSLPYQSNGRLVPAGVINAGIAFCLDDLGVVAAVDAGTGRPLWIRRMSPAEILPRMAGPPWSTTAPIVDGDTLVMLSPDGRRIVRIDQRTGALLAERPTAELGDPDYIVRAGDRLACVSERVLALLDLDGFEEAPASLSRSYSDPGIRGRVFVAGSRVFVPLQGEIAWFDAATPKDERRTPIDVTGNLLALDGQVIAVDEDRVRSYLAWEIASDLLLERMTRDPLDAEPAVTLAELAYRAGRHDRIAQAVDAALRAIARHPAGDSGTGQRLYDALRRMIETSQAAWDGVVGDDNRITSTSVLAELIDRLGRLSDADEEIVAHRMVLGRLLDVTGNARPAVEAYQEILSDRDLASSTWRGQSLSVRAEIEATRRLERLLRERGLGVYADFDRVAAIEAQGLSGARSPEAIEMLARRYPAAAVTPALWLQAADRREKTGRIYAAERNLRAGLAAARLRVAGGAATPDVTGELAGRLVTTQVDSGRFGAAAETLRAFRADFGDRVRLTADGGAITAGELAERLRELTGQTRSAALLGAHLSTDASPELLPGTPLEPVVRARDAGFDMVLLHASRRQELRLARVSELGLAVSWTRGAEPMSRPTLLHLGERAAVVLWSKPQIGPIDPGSGTPSFVECIDLTTGDTLWRSETMHDMLSGVPTNLAADPIGPRSTIQTPRHGAVSAAQLLVALDETTLVLAERRGRTAAFDLTSGRVLWTRRLALSRVYDLDVAGGVCVIGGDRPVEMRDRAQLDEIGLDFAPTLVAIEARSGELMHRVDDTGGTVRWLRVTDSGDVVVGLDTGLLSIGLLQARRNWITTTRATRYSADAWIFGDRLFVLGEDAALWLGSVASGRFDAEPLTMYAKTARSGVASARRIGDHIAFSSPAGVVVFGRHGELLGADSLDADDGLLPATVGGDFVITAESRSTGRRGAARHRVHILDAASAKSIATATIHVPDEINAAAQSVHALDGWILVSFGELTMPIGAPAR